MKANTRFESVQALRLTVVITLLTAVISGGAWVFLISSFSSGNVRQAEAGRMAAEAIGLYAEGLQMCQATRNILLDPRNGKAWSNFETAAAQFETTIGSLEAGVVRLYPGSEAARVPADVRKDYQAHLAIQKKVHQAAREDDFERGKQILNREDTPLWRTYKQKMLDLRQDLDQKLSAGTAAMERRYQWARVLSWGSSILLIAASAMAFVVARRMIGALTGSVRVLEAVAGGDFTEKIERSGEDEVGRMAEALNTAVARVREALREIRERAGGVSEAAEQLATAADKLAGGAQQQASGLEETSASMEEMTGTVKQNAESAQTARQLSQASRDSAVKGGEVVSAAMTAMGEINASSKRISEIISTIDEIAFQTNLLALNAAVEAARAGEQGHGFAVVAAEVRNLAQRSAAAAKEIKTLIQDSVGKVEAGTAMVDRSGQTLQEIVTGVKRVTDIVMEISAASAEQATGVEQVSRALTQMDRITQANSAQTEELSATAQKLNEQAGRMSELVAHFRLERDAAGWNEHGPPAASRGQSS